MHRQESHRLAVFLLLAVALVVAGSAVAAPGTPTSPGMRERANGAETPGTVTRYWSAPGGSLRAMDSNQVWASLATNCLYEPAGGSGLWASRGLELPDGAHISRIEMTGIDNNPSFNMAATLMVSDLFGAVVYSPGVQSAGSSPSGAIWGTNVDVDVDNYNFVYGIDWTDNGATGTSMLLCGLVVTYEVPVTSALLPLHLRNQP